MTAVLAKEKVVVAYNLYKKELDDTIKVQIIDSMNRIVIRQVFVPYKLATNSWKEFETVVRFSFRKHHNIELPRPWSHLNFTI